MCVYVCMHVFVYCVYVYVCVLCLFMYVITHSTLVSTPLLNHKKQGCFFHCKMATHMHTYMYPCVYVCDTRSAFLNTHSLSHQKYGCFFHSTLHCAKKLLLIHYYTRVLERHVVLISYFPALGMHLLFPHAFCMFYLSTRNTSPLSM